MRVGPWPRGDGLGREKAVGGVDGRTIGYRKNFLTLELGTKALLARVLIFDFERMPVGTFDLNSHVRPASRTAEDLEKLYSKSDEHSENDNRSPCPNACALLCLPQSLISASNNDKLGMNDE